MCWAGDSVESKTIIWVEVVRKDLKKENQSLDLLLWNIFPGGPPVGHSLHLGPMARPHFGS